MNYLLINNYFVDNFLVNVGKKSALLKNAQEACFLTLQHEKMNMIFEKSTSFYLLNRKSSDK